jgi:hypothetical protein
MTKYHVSLRANATWLNPNCSDGSATASTGMTAQCTAQIVGAAAANADKPTATDASALPAADGRRPWSMGPAGSSSICSAAGVVVGADMSSQRAGEAWSQASRALCASSVLMIFKLYVSSIARWPSASARAAGSARSKGPKRSLGRAGLESNGRIGAGMHVYFHVCLCA